MWVVAEDLRVGDYLVAHDIYVGTITKAYRTVMVNNMVKLSEYSMVDVNPTYYITGPGTTLLRPNLSREQVYEWEGQGYDVARLD